MRWEQEASGTTCVGVLEVQLLPSLVLLPRVHSTMRSREKAEDRHIWRSLRRALETAESNLLAPQLFQFQFLLAKEENQTRFR